ncbi:DUF4118 domain-containing protein [Polynucleobacter paneuropaeus]|nr:DUF4118 domain-containing protein [Polynucleobacter paneuropaeus]
MAIFGVFIAFSIRYSLQDFLQGNIPMTFFIMNTIIIALFYGYIPSVLTIILSVPIAFFFFVPPFDSYDMPTPQDGFVFISYILIAFIAVGVVEWLQRERYKAVLISKVSDSNFRLLTQASLSLKKARSQESPE